MKRERKGGGGPEGGREGRGGGGERERETEILYNVQECRMFHSRVQKSADGILAQTTVVNRIQCMIQFNVRN